MYRLLYIVLFYLVVAFHFLSSVVQALSVIYPCYIVDLVQLISMNFLHCGSTFSNGSSVLTGNIEQICMIITITININY